MMITNLYSFRAHLILEAAKSFNDLNDYIILKLQAKSAIKMCLYNYVTQDIIGYVHCSKPGNQPFWEIERINADKGYGPLLYDLLMMSVYPTGIKPASLIKPAALSVYQYYQNHRSDVEKDMIDSSSVYYVDQFRNDVEGVSHKDANDLKLINCVYFLKPTQNFIELSTKSNALIKEYVLDEKKIIKSAENKFLDIYYA